MTDDERRALLDHAAACAECHAAIVVLATEPGRDQHAPAPAPDERLGRYVLGRLLGRGAMGVVYAARDPELVREVAIKVLRPGVALDRLRREAQALARLAHPNVVRVYDVGLHEGQPFIAMELVHGENLRAWLRTRRTLDEIVAVLVQAGRGLAAAHVAGLVHRDFKPDNVLLSITGGVVVGDFGLARASEAAGAAAGDAGGSSPGLVTATGAVIGTPAYMAPEQFDGEATAASDQYAFCVTAWEACFGRRPFAGTTASELRDQARAGWFETSDERAVPRRIERALRRGLSPRPADRFVSMAALVDALAPRRRRRWPWIAAAAATVAAGAAVVAGEPAPRVRAAVDQDVRPGCACPYSTCDGTCHSVCRAAGYRVGARVPGVNEDGRQEALLGASLDGDTLLYLAGRRCALDRLLLARRQGATFVPVDLTDRFAGHDVAIHEGCCTLSPDGRSLILSNAARTGFVRVGLDDAGAPAALLPPIDGPHLAVLHPVLAADERTLYYRVYDAGDGSRGGIHVAERAAPDAPFPAGRRLRGVEQRYEYVTGVSADGLTLFMTFEFSTRVLARASTAEPFDTPGGASRPPRLEGWRAVPLAGCARIVTTITPGGCEGEDLAYLEALPR